MMAFARNTVYPLLLRALIPVKACSMSRSLSQLFEEANAPVKCS